KLKRNVELAPAEQRPIEYVVDTTGALEAEGQTDIAAGVSGVVDEVLFREGQWVDGDCVLVKVDQKRYLAAAEVARANERAAERELEMARKDERYAQASGSGTAEAEKVRKELAVRVAEAKFQSAKAARALAENNLERSQVRAPYPGQINQRKVTPGT